MGILRPLFGPSHTEIWSQLADQLGGKPDSFHFFVGREHVFSGVARWLGFYEDDPTLAVG